MENKNKISSHYAEVKGARMHYFKAGQGPHHLLLLPGGFTSSKIDVILQLENMSAQEFTMIAPDYRGLGLSRPPVRDWSGDFHRRDAEDMAELMQVIGIRYYSILGVCVGGTVGFLISGLYPDRIHKLVAYGARAFLKEQDRLLSESLVQEPDKWRAFYSKAAAELYGKEGHRQLVKNRVDSLIMYFKERAGNFCMAEVGNITCPTLIIHGDLDKTVPLYHPEYLNRRIKNSVVYHFPEGGHLHHKSDPPAFNGVCENFLLHYVPKIPVPSKI